MGTIQPKGESMRKAVKWISEERREKPGKNIVSLVDEAGMRFNLSPEEAEFLLRFIKESREKD
ncbi:MAG: hypothetical protein V1793_19040 [Pseudomonadota bacterium]